MPQLQINQGPQDALLYDNSRSYFTNVGYVRTSNFQVEYRHVDSQNNAAFGTTVQYIIPKAADLLGPVDLRVKIPAGTDTFELGSGAIAGANRVWSQWVDELGFALIEKLTFSVGSNDIETLTGEQLQIRNELMTSDEMRLGFGTVQKTGRRAFPDLDSTSTDDGCLPGTADKNVADFVAGAGPVSKASGFGINKDYTRIIECIEGTTKYRAGARELIIPLGLFFTKHVSQYFPLAAVAGCNDIRISIKFRALNELLQIGGIIKTPAVGETQQIGKVQLPKIAKIDEARLFCHYVHVTGPEAQILMNKEHVRLLKLYQHQPETFSSITSEKLEMNLSFLHPVSTLIVTIRAANDLNSKAGSVEGAPPTTDASTYPIKDVYIGRKHNLKTGEAQTNADRDADAYDMAGKGFFFYHGDGTNPNYDRLMCEEDGSTLGQGTVKVSNIALTLNGQERHPGLDKGLDMKYIRERLLPMLHSNSSQKERGYQGVTTSLAQEQEFGTEGSKNILVYPFSLNPEGTNPSGAVNFSKVSHAKLTLHLDKGPDGTTGPLALESDGLPKDISSLRVDVYALYYNWLQIKDGRALLSFA